MDINFHDGHNSKLPMQSVPITTKVVSSNKSMLQRILILYYTHSIKINFLLMQPPYDNDAPTI
jgi:hypothetical protein